MTAAHRQGAGRDASTSTTHRSRQPDALIETVALVHVIDGRLLLVQPHGKRAFYLPGGKVDPGETDLEALARELLEELAVTLIDSTCEYLGLVEAPAYGMPETVLLMRCYKGEFRGSPSVSSEIAQMDYFNSSEYARCHDQAAAVVILMNQLTSKGLMT